MEHQSEVGIAVNTDELVDFLQVCASDTRSLVRQMSINAVERFRLSSSTVGDMTLLYFRAGWNEKINPAVAEIMIWIRDLAAKDKMVYYMNIDQENMKQEEVRTRRFGSFGLTLKSTIDFSRQERMERDHIRISDKADQAFPGLS